MNRFTEARRTLSDRFTLTVQPWPESPPCMDERPTFDEAMTHLERPSGRMHHTAAVKRAQAVCKPCLMREACLRFALDQREGRGVWAATTPQQRTNILRRERRRTA